MLTLTLLGAEQIRPPVSTCLRPACAHAPLSEPRQVQARLWTLRRGVLPVWSLSLYCRSCLTRYYNNYFVHEASHREATREYYGAMPRFIHVTEQSFIELALCIFFETQMAMLHASAENIARVYNHSLSLSEKSALHDSRLSDQLDLQTVWDSFFMHALLRDSQKREQALSLPHHGLQSQRFNLALAERNYRMAGTGQEMWAHACKGCMKVIVADDGQTYCLTAGVTDGVTLGHPCCSVIDCTVPLSKQQDRFCAEHTALLRICSVDGCQSEVAAGHATCPEPSHRAFEDAHRVRGTAMFALRNRAQDAHEAQPQHPDPPDPPDRPSSNTVEQPSVGGPSEQPSTTAVKGRLLRRWTHNEQLFVRCCGVIISRATFFGSEGISGVKDFLKATFPPTFPGSLPCYIFYDNNCQLRKHLLSTGDHYFDFSGLPVDVFHALTKHKASDLFCQLYCNPACFPELMGPDNRWIFNSSAAEQANNWFGRFLPVVHEMTVERYNFFLDEMIAIHNRFTVESLRRRGFAPHLQPEEYLRDAPVRYQPS
ncbi:hypothetical protein FA95DRAFT_1489519 [Auriscalpium vulgare]|uniref:Uncharacterized protein n=1 Tax=Auriscalpium vulgare TaxID=40419 RepID=A0ACB8RZM5_9AGAM|nr:hypothetical protein FA95DRAFT_1489519 [Auriscalpium vulgare]